MKTKKSTAYWVLYMAAFLLLAMLSAAPLAMAADKTTVSIGPGDSHEDRAGRKKLDRDISDKAALK